MIAWVAMVSYVLFRLWNLLSAHLQVLPAITWWQAVGLYLIVTLVLMFFRRRIRKKHGPWFMHKRWKKMSDSEKEALLAFMEKKTGCKKSFSQPSKEGSSV